MSETLVPFFPSRSGFDCQTCHRPCCRVDWLQFWDKPSFDKAKKVRPEIQALTINKKSDGVTILHSNNQGCLFLDPKDSLCSLHKEFGMGGKPSSCQVWPHLFVEDIEKKRVLAFQAECAGFDEDGKTSIDLNSLAKTYQTWVDGGRFPFPAYEKFFSLFKQASFFDRVFSLKQKIGLYQRIEFQNEYDYAQETFGISTSQLKDLEKETLSYFFCEKNHDIADVVLKCQSYTFAHMQQKIFSPSQPYLLELYQKRETDFYQIAPFYLACLLSLAKRLVWYRGDRFVEKSDMKLARDLIGKMIATQFLDKNFSQLVQINKTMEKQKSLVHKLKKPLQQKKNFAFSLWEYF